MITAVAEITAVGQVQSLAPGELPYAMGVAKKFINKIQIFLYAGSTVALENTSLPLEWLSSERWTSIGKAVERWEPSHIAEKNVK